MITVVQEMVFYPFSVKKSKSSLSIRASTDEEKLLSISEKHHLSGELSTTIR